MPTVCASRFAALPDRAREGACVVPPGTENVGVGCREHDAARRPINCSGAGYEVEDPGGIVPSQLLLAADAVPNNGESFGSTVPLCVGIREDHRIAVKWRVAVNAPQNDERAGVVDACAACFTTVPGCHAADDHPVQIRQARGDIKRPVGGVDVEITYRVWRDCTDR